MGRFVVLTYSNGACPQKFSGTPGFLNQLRAEFPLSQISAFPLFTPPPPLRDLRDLLFNTSFSADLPRRCARERGRGVTLSSRKFAPFADQTSSQPIRFPGLPGHARLPRACDKNTAG